MSVVRTRSTHVLCEPEQPARILTVDFDAFAARIVSLEEPEQKHVDDLMAGLDLIRAMSAESDDFGHAAPGTDARADFAERVRALTDEALEAAGDLIEEAGQREAGGTPAPENALARAAEELAFDCDLHPALVEAVTGIPPECDPAVGAEFV